LDSEPSAARSANGRARKDGNAGRPRFAWASGGASGATTNTWFSSSERGVSVDSFVALAPPGEGESLATSDHAVARFSL
jgi:hypothetical protein